MAAKSIGTLKASLTLDNRAFLMGFKQAQGAVKASTTSIGSVVNRLTNSVTGSMVAIGTAAATSAFGIHRLTESFSRVDREAKLADRLGVTFQSLKKLSIAASESGTDMETLVRAVMKMNQNIGSGGKSLDERFFQVAESITAIKDPAERANKAIATFGKNGFELLTLLQNAAKIKESANAIDRLGLALSRADAGKIERANDAIGRLLIVATAAFDKLAVTIAPHIEEFANTTLSLFERLNKALDEYGDKWKFIGIIVKAQLDSTALVWNNAIATIETATIALNELSNALQGVAKSQLLVSERFRFLDMGFSGFFSNVKKTSLNQKDKATPGSGLDSLMGSKTVKPGAFELNSVDAVRAIQNAGGDGTSGIIIELKNQIRVLERIAKNGDPLAAAARDEQRLIMGRV